MRGRRRHRKKEAAAWMTALCGGDRRKALGVLAAVRAEMRRSSIVRIDLRNALKLSLTGPDSCSITVESFDAGA